MQAKARGTKRSGSATILAAGPKGEHQLGAGDIAHFPRGPSGAHQVRNRGAAPARILLVSTMLSPEIGEYPDSGKLIVAAGATPTPAEEAPLELLFRRESAIGEAGWVSRIPIDLV